MIKKLIKSASVLICSLITMSCISLTAFASSKPSQKFDGDTSSCMVYDEKGLFSDEELDMLNSLVRETSEELNLYIAIYLSDTPRSDPETERFAAKAYEEMFSPDSDGVFYYMDLSEQYSAYDYISTSGLGILYYQDDLSEIIQRILPYLPSSGEPIYSDDIYNAICKILETFKQYADTPDYMYSYHDENKDTYIYYRDGKTVISTTKPLPLILKDFLLFALVPGIIVGFIFYFAVKSHYKFKRSCNPSAYVTHEKTHFDQREDRFIRTRTTRHKIEHNSSGGGSSSSHSGGGGSGSHGGGGFHR